MYQENFDEFRSSICSITTRDSILFIEDEATNTIIDNSLELINSLDFLITEINNEHIWCSDERGKLSIANLKLSLKKIINLTQCGELNYQEYFNAFLHIIDNYQGVLGNIRHPWKWDVKIDKLILAHLQGSLPRKFSKRFFRKS